MTGLTNSLKWKISLSNLLMGSDSRAAFSWRHTAQAFWVNRNNRLCFASALGFTGVTSNKQWLSDVIGEVGIVILYPKLSDYTYKPFKLSYPGESQRRVMFYLYGGSSEVLDLVENLQF